LGAALSEQARHHIIDSALLPAAELLQQTLERSIRFSAT
jgi:hypothetical protein